MIQINDSQVQLLLRQHRVMAPQCIQHQFGEIAEIDRLVVVHIEKWTNIIQL